jgi:hypothetical protein
MEGSVWADNKIGTNLLSRRTPSLARVCNASKRIILKYALQTRISFIENEFRDISYNCGNQRYNKGFNEILRFTFRKS